MRRHFAWISFPLLALAACGGAGPESVGSVAPPASAGGTGNGGTGTGVGSTGSTPAPAATTFLDLSTAKTFDAVGSMQSLSVDAGAELYQGNASTVRTPSGQITYDPRDGVFEIAFADTKAGIDRNIRFQDPAHRTDFPNSNRPALEVPNLDGFNYLGALDGTEVATFFYQRPGNSTAYVSLAGFVRTEGNATSPTYKAERGVFVFGDLTPQAQTPRSGTGSYTGGFLATMVGNTTLDSDARAESYVQWLTGSSKIDVDFGKATVALALSGSVGQAYIKDVPVSDLALGVPSGTSFTATGSATIDFVRSGGFTGGFTSAGFSNGTKIDFRAVNPGDSVAGASSIDGAFFGPDAINVGGNFRIVGGIPDQRVDILGAFTGAKK